MSVCTKYILAVATALLCVGSASAQFTIKPQKDSIKIEPLQLIGNAPSGLDKNFFDRAAHEAERRRLRKERNTVEFNASLETSLQQFENWTGSGTNNFYVLSNVFFRHQYKKNRISADYRTDINFGMNYIDGKLFKNKDEFRINAQLGLTAAGNWSYSMTSNLRSQFAPGKKSRTDETVVSKFMSPGYFDIAAGFTYSRKDFPLKVTLSPIGGNIITVLSREIADSDHSYGPARGERFSGGVGPSTDIYYDQTFGKKKSFRYRSNLYVFSPYNNFWNPTCRWENTVDIRLSKYISTKLYGQLFYLREASAKLQYQYSFMIGLKYTFKNK